MKKIFQTGDPEKKKKENPTRGKIKRLLDWLAKGGRRANLGKGGCPT